LTTHHPLEARLYRLMMQKARRVIVVADSSKVGKVAFSLIADCTVAHVLVTDGGLTQEDRSAWAAAGLEIETA
jgi:DeoR family transcriptional regulator of aga operon